jgi:hypothetical protein
MYDNTTMVLQWFYNGVTIVIQWRCNGVTVNKQSKYSWPFESILHRLKSSCTINEAEESGFERR